MHDLKEKNKIKFKKKTNKNLLCIDLFNLIRSEKPTEPTKLDSVNFRF